MNIALMSHDNKKELMVQFCTAYAGILSQHHIYATNAYNEIDLVLLFTDPNTTEPWDDAQMIETIRHCDKHNVPIATNLATAEMLIMGLQRGDLDWRDIVNPKTKPFTT